MLQRIARKLPAQGKAPIRRAMVAVGLRQARSATDGRSATFATMTPETPPALDVCLRRARETGVRGDYFEFGLFQGYTLWHAYSVAREHDESMRFFGFDSFLGIPTPKGVDAVTAEFAEGDYACSLEEVVANLAAQDVDWSRILLVPGFYEDSLTDELKVELALGLVAVALIDCDLYESTVSVLRFLGEFLQDGSILMFDDWNCFGASDDMGERRAFREFLEACPLWTAERYISFGWHGQSFIMRHRR